MATRVGALPDIIKDGESGVLVSPGSSSELTEAIQKVLQDKSVAKRIGGEAKKAADRFPSWEKTLPDFEKVLEAAVGR